MAKRKLEPHELRRLVEEEGASILGDLVGIAKEDSGRALRGKGLMPVVEMAAALGWTRQLTHRTIREAELRHDDVNVS